MRPLLACALCLTLFAGCNDPPAEPVPPEPQTSEPESFKTRTENFTGTIDIAADLTTGIGLSPCQLPLSDCTSHFFTINDTSNAMSTPDRSTYRLSFDVHVELTWLNSLNDFDFYILKDDAIVGSGTRVLSPSESEDFELEPGAYEVVVDPYLVVSDSYQLQVRIAAHS